MTRASAIVAIGLLTVVSAGRFGPNNCVTLSRSELGTCVISTDCDKEDTSKVEFAFDCEQGSSSGKPGEESNEITWHSFGVGGFEAQEDFDTEVKCARCTVPSASPPKPAAKPVQVPKPAAKPVQVSSAKATTAASVKNAVKAPSRTEAQAVPGSVSLRAKARRNTMVSYGPDGCVKTWKSSASHCIMETKCKGKDMEGYDYGLVCVDKTGAPTRHLFGTDSFDAEETFDTLIVCDQCLGLQSVPKSVGLTGELRLVAKDVAHLEEMMANMTKNVDMLDKQVFKTTVAPAPVGFLIHRKPAEAAQPKQRAHHHKLQAVRTLKAHAKRAHHKKHARLRSHHHHQPEADEQAREPQSEAVEVETASNEGDVEQQDDSDAMEDSPGTSGNSEDMPAEEAESQETDADADAEPEAQSQKAQEEDSETPDADE